MNIQNEKNINIINVGSKETVTYIHFDNWLELNTGYEKLQAEVERLRRTTTTITNTTWTCPPGMRLVPDEHIDSKPIVWVRDKDDQLILCDQKKPGEIIDACRIGIYGFESCLKVFKNEMNQAGIEVRVLEPVEDPTCDKCGQVIATKEG